MLNKVFKTALVLVGLSVSAFAADLVPQDSKGNFTFPNYAGSKSCVIGASTGTAAALCATGSGIILQVIPTTTTTQAIVLRDSATANTSSTVLGAVTSSSVAGIFVYPRFYNGLSVNAISGAGTNEAWTIIYSQPK